MDSQDWDALSAQLGDSDATTARGGGQHVPVSEGTRVVPRGSV